MTKPTMWLMRPAQTQISLAGADPGILARGFKLAEGVRFVQFDHFFLKFPMKMK